MTFAWLVECRTCLQRFPVERRTIVEGKSTDQLKVGDVSKSFECPHCHEIHEYSPGDYIPGEGRV